jgi:hypothetical protein
VWTVVLTGVLLIASCSEPAAPPPVEKKPTEPPPPTPPAPTYRVTLPEGKLPWPHHAPEWDEARFRQMLSELWVINNFAAYQGSADRASLYLHSGLDVVLRNGTPIYAVQSGWVRANVGGSEYYRTLYIEDEDRPGRGWGYTHIYHFTVRPGDYVHRGTMIGRVNFQGIEHIHLSRVVLPPGGMWEFSETQSVHADDYFIFEDTEPPVFEGEFRYVRNGADEPFMAGADGFPLVSGDVDIVIGLRDPGEWTRSKVPFAGPGPYGDRHAPVRVEYDIEAPDGGVERFVGFDLRRVALTSAGPGAARLLQVLGLYQHYESVYPPAPPVGNYNQRWGYYIITNSDGAEPGPHTIDEIDPRRAWRTAATDGMGRRRYPDGLYEITVRAFDSSGNMASRAGRVRVAN